MMKYIKRAGFVFYLLVFTTTIIIKTSASIDLIPKFLYDEAALFTNEQTQDLNKKLFETGEEVGFNVAFLTSNDVGNDKSDRGVANYADVYYDNRFGVNTDGILFLINEDTKYDYITTSGICIGYFTDARIDSMHDAIFPYIKIGDYAGAVNEFCRQVKNYAGAGKPSDYYEIPNTYHEYSEGKASVEVNTFAVGIGAGAVLGIIVFITVCLVTRSRYRIKPARNAVDYLKHDSIRYRQRSDTFIRMYITKRKIETQSSSGGGGSSTHTSSSGGSHGGGGHHR